jgi:hypothetical protein
VAFASCNHWDGSIAAATEALDEPIAGEAIARFLSVAEALAASSLVPVALGRLPRRRGLAVARTTRHQTGGVPEANPGEVHFDDYNCGPR